jgi:hypothetical protein
LVTGAGRGSGQAIAERLSKDGITVINYAHNQVEAQALAKTLASRGAKAIALKADMGNPLVAMYSSYNSFWLNSFVSQCLLAWDTAYLHMYVQASIWYIRRRKIRQILLTKLPVSFKITVLPKGAVL